MFLEACVILFTGVGVPGQVHHSLDQTPPLGPGTPPGTRYTPSGTRYTPWDQVHPPGAVHAGRYGQQAGSTHPTGMHSC